jgi:hypothetical protein
MQRLLGRWDLTVGEGANSYPSWVELTPRGGSFVGRFGSARPLGKVEYSNDGVKFTLPPQYESRKDELVFKGALSAGKLSGTTTFDDGTATTWTGKPAPELPSYTPSWRETSELVKADLSNWTLRSPDWVGNWSIDDGMLVNSARGSDLVTVGKFGDFKLIAEYRYPKGSNSGIYLRGRYEFQIIDDYESGAHGVGSSAAIYGFLAPSKNTIMPPDEWNTAEITLIGRFVTVVLNGETVIENQEIPGITGGALDSDEAAPGPIFVQGDHGPVTFRRLSITPGLRL